MSITPAQMTELIEILRGTIQPDYSKTLKELVDIVEDVGLELRQIRKEAGTLAGALVEIRKLLEHRYAST